MGQFKAGVLVWFWDGEAQRTGVISTWGRKNVVIVPTPCGKVKTVTRPHTDVNEPIPWGGGRKRISFKGWLRMARKHGAAYGYTKTAQVALRKLETLK